MTDASRARIVVGVDGSEGSKNALRWARHLARLTDARLDVVAAWQYAALFGLTARAELEFPAGDIERSLNETVDEVFGVERPAGLRIKALEGPADETLISASTGALMLVVGSRGHGALAGLVLGSVSARVAGHAECPVLVVHGEPPPAG